MLTPYTFKYIPEDFRSVKDLYSNASIAVKPYITSLYRTGVRVTEYKDFFNTEKALYKLHKYGQLIECVETKSTCRKNSDDDIYTYSDVDKHFLFFYKDNFIRLSIDEEISLNNNTKEKCTLQFNYPVGYACADKDFLNLITGNNQPSVFILNQEYGEFVFSKFSVSLPERIDLDLNYGENFSKTNDLIIESINTNHSGLYMFHGPPGTGKSTYIKYLSNNIKKDVIFFPTSLVHMLTDPSIINLLIRKQNCVLVLEDAEKAIIKRENACDASLVSSLLNMTDGILGDVLKLNIIVTYNCGRTDIDEALLRRGRLKAEHSFKLLLKDQAKKLVSKLKLDVIVNDEMSLADIYNFKKEEELIGNKSEINKKTAIGFGS